MNERTSKRVAKIAGRVLALRGRLQVLPSGRLCDYCFGPGIKWSDIRALAASCLTQTADKPKRKKPRRPYVAPSPRPAPRAKRKGK